MKEEHQQMLPILQYHLKLYGFLLALFYSEFPVVLQCDAFELKHQHQHL